jgi:CheY-like chemotaxis protein
MTILLAEDREDDVLLIQRAFKKAGFPGRLMVVQNGDEAVRYLSGVGKFSARNLFPFPTLLLLDLKLPLIDGFEVLRWIRARPDLKELPVIVLSSADRIRDVNDAYALGAYSFLIKTSDFSDTANFAQTLAWYWTELKNKAGLNMPPAVWPKKANLAPDSGTPAYPQPRGTRLAE